MNLLSRVNRLEQKRPYDRFADMTEEELEEAIALVTAEIETATGMSAFDYVEMLARDGGGADLDPDAVRTFVASMKRIGSSEINSGTIK